MITRNLLNKQITLRTYDFKGTEIGLYECDGDGINISRSSIILSEILPDSFKGRKVLDLGCGSGFMSIGALMLGASSVLATDIEDVSAVLTKSVKHNKIRGSKLSFKVSNMLESIDDKDKFDLIIANLPQHALPATKNAKNLTGKYGGYDGTDLVCKAITESLSLLKRNGSYFGAISELTNFKRTFDLASVSYEVKVIKTVQKELRPGEMCPILTDGEIMAHLDKLKKAGLINYVGDMKKNPIKYKVHLVQLIRK